MSQRSQVERRTPGALSHTRRQLVHLRRSHLGLLANVPGISQPNRRTE